MKIINQSNENLTKVQIFKCTLAPSIGKMSESEGEVFQVCGWVLYQDADRLDPSKTNTILSVFDENGTVRATNSATFTQMFMDIAELMEEPGYRIVVVGGKSKNDRHFITCDLVE